MTRMPRLIVVSLILLLSVPTVAKADGYDWTGMYIGINSGVAFGKGHTDVTARYDPLDYFDNSSIQSINNIGERKLEDLGYTGGVQAGFDQQLGPVVFGLVTDFDRFDLNDSDHVLQTYPCCGPAAYQIQNTLETDWLFTLRGRLGFALDRLLVFGSGGVAVTDLKEHFEFTDDLGPGQESGLIRAARIGWTVGGGLEFALFDHVSVSAEYLHVDFRRKSRVENDFLDNGVLDPNNHLKHSIDLESEIGRVAVNFRF
jgi:outer membrane immunogenic protein